MEQSDFWSEVLLAFTSRYPELYRDLPLIATFNPIPNSNQLQISARKDPKVAAAFLEVGFDPDYSAIHVAGLLSEGLQAFRQHCFALPPSQEAPTGPFEWSSSPAGSSPYNSNPTPSPPSIPLSPREEAHARLEQALRNSDEQALLDAQIDRYLASKPAPPTQVP